MKKNYKSTVNACFAGYVVQAIVNNFVPLLFLTFNKSYGIELTARRQSWLMCSRRRDLFH